MLRATPFHEGVIGLAVGGRSPGSRDRSSAPSRAIVSPSGRAPPGAFASDIPGHSGGGAPGLDQTFPNPPPPLFPPNLRAGHRQPPPLLTELSHAPAADPRDQRPPPQTPP